jgi:hypothetical protein
MLILSPAISLAQAEPTQGQTPAQPPTAQAPQVDAPVLQIAGAQPVVVVNPPPPKTRLQAMAEQKGVMVLCGYTDVGQIQREDGSFVRVTAAQFTNSTTTVTEYGLLVFVHEVGSTSVRETRSFIDADELDGLLGSLDSLSKLDHTATPMNNFDAKIRTRGDLEIANIDDAGAREIAFQGVEIVASTGIENWAATRFPLARVAEFEQYLNTAKQILDKARQDKPSAQAQQ